MRPPRPIAFSRRLLLLASLLLGIFVLFDLGLFGWLIFRSLSQRQVDEILLTTRQEAEGLAAAQGEPNLKAFAEARVQILAGVIPRIAAIDA